MGYRSNVTIQCKEKAFKLFKVAGESVEKITILNLTKF